MNNGYYIIEDGDQKGPYTLTELTGFEIDIHSRILSPDVETWQDACDLPELYPYFEALGVYFPTGDNLASFGWRFLAFLIDYIIISFVLSLIITIVAPGFLVSIMKSYNDMLKSSHGIDYSDMLKLEIGVYTAIIINDLIGGLSAMRGSIGKKICKLVVVDVDGTGLSFGKILLRSVGKIISLSFYGLGFLSILFTEHRQAMHDYLAKSYVVKRD